MRATEGVTGRIAAGVRGIGGAIRRHPWRAVLALPLALVLYAAVLYPFTPSIGDIRKSKQEQPSIVLSADGKELAVFKRANRDWVKLEDISPKVTEALLATEDRRFYDHPGIDFVRTARAILNTIMGEREGGSTITQQLARNLYPEEIGREVSVTRKIKEAITALKIEAVYSKDEILETYLNSVSFLYNAWGIEMASRTYFDKSARELDELEAATLIGMLKGTAYYNPVLNPERALQRRNTVLAMMVEEGKLAQTRYDRLKAQPLRLDFERVPESESMAPHLSEYLRRWLIDWADRHDYNIYADGLVVRTTIDSRLQEMANRAVERQTKALQAVADVEWSRRSLVALGSDPANYVAQRGRHAPFEYFWNSRSSLVKAWIRDTDEYRQAREQGQGEEEALKELEGNAQFMAQLRRKKTMLQAGFMALEPATGSVKAWVGSRDFREDKFDHVQQARRQAGSTFKPFVYGAAFEMGHSPAETLMDEQVSIQIDRNKFWRPGDVDGAPTGQPMTLRDGLARSKNTITAQLMMQVGPSRVASLARAMGVRESKLEEVPSLALGTSPVTLKEMVTSFATIANGGNYIEPVIVTAVEDRSGNVLESIAPRGSEQALSNQAAMTLLDVLRGVVEYGTAVGLRPRFGLSGDLAGKTGTSQDNVDGWFILMHPQLVSGAWVGFNDNRVAMRSSYWGQGSHNALLLVGDFMQQATRSSLVDAKAKFAAPRMRELEKPLLDRMGDWWNSVFNTPTEEAPEPEVAALPPVELEPLELEPLELEPLELEPPPDSGTAAAADPLLLPPPALPLPPVGGPPVSPDAPVIAERPQRVPSFPRPLEPARPIETVPGTQVYTMPPGATPGAQVDRLEPPGSRRDASRSAEVGRASPAPGTSPSRTITLPPPTASMGAQGSGMTPPAESRDSGFGSSPASRRSGTGSPIGSQGSEPAPAVGAQGSDSAPLSGSPGSSPPASGNRADSSTGMGSGTGMGMGSGTGMGSGSGGGSSDAATAPMEPAPASSPTVILPPSTSPASDATTAPADIGQASGSASSVQ